MSSLKVDMTLYLLCKPQYTQLVPDKQKILLALTIDNYICQVVGPNFCRVRVPNTSASPFVPEAQIEGPQKYQGGNGEKQGNLVSKNCPLAKHQPGNTAILSQSLSVFPSSFLSFNTIRQGNKVSFPFCSCPLSARYHWDYEGCVMGSSSSLNISWWQLSSLSSPLLIAQEAPPCDNPNSLCSMSFLWLLAPMGGCCLHSYLPFPEMGLNHPLVLFVSTKQGSLIIVIGFEHFNCLCHLENSICLLSSIAALPSISFLSIESSRDQ